MRSFEDAIDTLLMRSRAEAELARLTSDAQRLAALADTIAALAADSPLRCALAADDAVADDGAAAADGVDGAAATTDGVRVRALRINSIAYVRGKARVAVDKLHLPVPGVYAIAGPNGSGKSTLFALIGACHQALLRGDSTTMPFAGSRTPSGAAHLPAGLMITSMGGDVELPRRADGAPPYVIEVSQRQYTPLHCRAHPATVGPCHPLTPSPPTSAIAPHPLLLSLMPAHHQLDHRCSHQFAHLSAQAPLIGSPPTSLWRLVAPPPVRRSSERRNWRRLPVWLALLPSCAWALERQKRARTVARRVVQTRLFTHCFGSTRTGVVRCRAGSASSSN